MLTDRRRAIRHLLDPQKSADARASYYALHHPENRTTLIPYPPEGARATGYICLSRTGLDLFRPLMTMRLPQGDMLGSLELIHTALPVGASVLMSANKRDLPIVRATFQIEREQMTHVLALDRGRFEPIVNVLTTIAKGANGLPRVVVRKNGETLASASVNWRSAAYAEINVTTSSQQRRRGLGRSVVAGLCEQLLQKGIRPIYVVSAENHASIKLAESVGFIDTGARLAFLEATLLRRP
ncbi:MAG: GNAT family N-acetyltransferase [Candidatus Promineifilaceae bacterium]